MSDLGNLLLAQIYQDFSYARALVDWLREHPPIKSPMVMVCGRPWWIWYDELGDPIRFAWVEDRLNEHS